ncbi:hypothetical protein [Candidatus Phycosocius spiralis]|uniref:hypothetical protein n=1 Tax=Candidatus Phycosocius spiralis TaxID=2815099 RepID=UPI0024E11B71|nr:hypothetical protein [Candidatus Phycosocius spiralis]
MALTAPAFGNSALAQEKKLEAADRSNLELNFIVMPIVRDGVLENYIFVLCNVRMQDVSQADFVREKHFLVRDAITKQTSRNPIPAGKTRNSYDTGAISRAITTAITSIKPGLKVVKVQLTKVEFMGR